MEGSSKPTRWYNLISEEVLKALHSDRSWLSESEAQKRLHKYGLNELREQGRTSPLIIFLRQFASPLIYILLVAALIELLIMHKPIDAAVILTVVTINSILGFVQESRAERAMEALK